MTKTDKLARFDEAVAPHLGAAYNLARWLVRDERDAEDVVQEASLRAFASLEGYRGGDSRAWLLAIVRNACYSWLRKKRVFEPLEEDAHPVAAGTPETLLLDKATGEELRAALEQLPPEYREVLVLRELEDMSYKEIAAVTGLPAGTVMSRLSRARRRMESLLAASGGRP